VAGALCFGGIIHGVYEWDTFQIVGFGVGTSINLLGSVHQFSNYKRVKKLLEEKGYDDKIVRPKSYSWCDRYAVNQAVKQTGYLDEYRDFNQREGHKWYHILPKVHRFIREFPNF